MSLVEGLKQLRQLWEDKSQLRLIRVSNTRRSCNWQPVVPTAHRWRMRSLHLFGLWLCVAALLAAQTTAALRGLVLDPSGAVIPDAGITLSGPNDVHQTGAANDAGRFSFLGLAPGDYTIRATAPGFADSETKVNLDNGRVTSLDIHMTVAAARQEVTIPETLPSQVQVDPSQNAAQIVVQGKDLDVLADNADDMQADLQA